MSVITPNMNLIQSSVGIDTGLSWEQNLNSSLNTLDGHNHAPGSGVQISPDGLNINAALPFNSNQATSLAYLNFTAQGGSVPAPVDLSLSVTGNELFYKDGVGNNVQLTASGSVNATSSGISSGTNTASFVSNTLVVIQSVGVGAAIDAASYILRYNGSYPSPSGNYITLAAPAALSGGYQITLPAAAPVSANSFLAESTSGTVSYINVDNSTLSISGSNIQVATGGITATQIANLTITAAQIANNTITRQQEAAVGQVSSPMFPATQTFTGTTAATAITGLTVTLTSTGRPLIICIQPKFNPQAKVTVDPNGINQDVFIQVNVDSSPELSYALTEVQSASTPSMTTDMSRTFIYPTTAGSHTVDVYVKAVNTGTIITIQEYQLIVYEL